MPRVVFAGVVLLLALLPHVAQAGVTCKPFPDNPYRLLCSDGTIVYLAPGFLIP